jgi:hypothetical protein
VVVGVSFCLFYAIGMGGITDYHSGSLRVTSKSCTIGGRNTGITGGRSGIRVGFGAGFTSSSQSHR